MTRDGGWVLARRFADATLLDLFASRAFDLPRRGDPDWPGDSRLADVLDAPTPGWLQRFEVPLAQFRLQRADAVSMQERAGARPRRPSTSI